MANLVSYPQQICSVCGACCAPTFYVHTIERLLTVADYIILHGALPGILNPCHLRTIEYVDLLGVNMVNPTVGAQYAHRTSVIEIDHHDFAVPIFAKFAVWPDAIKNIDQESQAYGLLRNQGIGPEVLAHIVEEGRIIGLVLERLEGHIPTIDDYAACQQALTEFHDRGLQHGNVQAKSFIVKDGRATMIDFEEVAPISNWMQPDLERGNLYYAMTNEDTPEPSDDDSI